MDIDESFVQEVLEHAYPSPLTIEFIAETLKISVEEILKFLKDLENKEIAAVLENGQWIRQAPALEQHAMHGKVQKAGPTVAIITALYSEKLAVDAMLESRETFVKYKTDGSKFIFLFFGKFSCLSF